MIEIVRVTPEVIASIQGRDVPFPVIAYVGLEDGVFLGCGGLAWRMGRCWLWLGFTPAGNSRPNHLVRYARRMLATAWQVGETRVHVERDQAEPMSARLLSHLGFAYIRDEPIVHDDGSAGELWRIERPI